MKKIYIATAILILALIGLVALVVVPSPQAPAPYEAVARGA